MSAIWVLTGAKTGDNAQILRAANAMGLPYEIRQIVLKPGFETEKPRVAPSLHHVDLARSSKLDPPWPDLVLTIGRRLSLVALWIRQQSGGRTRIALFNAPKGHAEDFDLIVAPRFYRLRDSEKVLRIGLPLIVADPAKIAAARETFAASFAPLARPLHVLLLGGDMGRRALDPAFALSVLAQMRRGHATQGSIYVSTSRRTPATVADAIATHLGPGDRLYRWQADDPANPYFGLLAHGDSFTITADSLSMLTEVARLGRPLYVAEPPARSAMIDKLISKLGLAPPRDLGLAINLLVEGGHAARLGSAAPATFVAPPDDTAAVAERLRHLVRQND